jgi:predicted small lipoprotein YifL
MLTRDSSTRDGLRPIFAIPALLALVALAISACGSKGDLVLPKAGASGPPPAMTRQQDSTVVPIQPAIPSPPSIPPATAPPAEPKQPQP